MVPQPSTALRVRTTDPTPHALGPSGPSPGSLLPDPLQSLLQCPHLPRAVLCDPHPHPCVPSPPLLQPQAQPLPAGQPLQAHLGALSWGAFRSAKALGRGRGQVKPQGLGIPGEKLPAANGAQLRIPSTHRSLHNSRRPALPAAARPWFCPRGTSVCPALSSVCQQPSEPTGWASGCSQAPEWPGSNPKPADTAADLGSALSSVCSLVTSPQLWS